MQCSHNSVLSQDIFFRAKKALPKNLLAPREAMQMLSNLEAAREAIKIFNERNNIKLPDNITETLNFNRNKTESANLPESAEETFAGIRARARKTFVEKADELNINWDISKYNPVALEQAIEEATHNSYLQDKNLCFCFSITKRLEV